MTNRFQYAGICRAPKWDFTDSPVLKSPQTQTRQSYRWLANFVHIANQSNRTPRKQRMSCLTFLSAMLASVPYSIYHHQKVFSSPLKFLSLLYNLATSWQKQCDTIWQHWKTNDDASQPCVRFRGVAVFTGGSSTAASGLGRLLRSFKGGPSWMTLVRIAYG